MLCPVAKMSLWTYKERESENCCKLPSYDKMSRVLEVSRQALLRCVMLLFYQVVTEENQDYDRVLGIRHRYAFTFVMKIPFGSYHGSGLCHACAGISVGNGRGVVDSSTVPLCCVQGLLRRGSKVNCSLRN